MKIKRRRRRQQQDGAEGSDNKRTEGTFILAQGGGAAGILGTRVAPTETEALKVRHRN